MHSYYQPDLECMPREDMTSLQNERLTRQVRRVYETVRYYRDLMDKASVKPGDVRSVEDLHKLPFLSKSDLREAYPDGLLAVPQEDVVRIHSTSGTTGKRVVAFHTREDIDIWEECAARALTAIGATSRDVVQVSYGYG